MKNILIGVRRCFFWTEADTIELSLIASRQALLLAEENSETAIYSIRMLEERIARIRTGAYGNQAKASIDIGHAQQRLDDLHLTLEISRRDARIMKDRIPRIEAHLRRASKSFQVNDKKQFLQPTTTPRGF